jgi:hypothetical protein
VELACYPVLAETALSSDQGDLEIWRTWVSRRGKRDWMTASPISLISLIR